MKERKNEMLTLRVSSRLKDWLKRLSSSNRLTMGQWVQTQVVRTMWKAIQKSAAWCATEQAAEESGIPEKEAVKLETPENALLIIPAEKHEEFKARVNYLYPIYLKQEFENTGFMGLDEELKDIDADWTMQEWEETDGIPKLQSYYHYTNGKLIPMTKEEFFKEGKK
jgi:hypothetical protein